MMLEVKNISKQFSSGKNQVLALKNINLKVEASEFVLIKGESGSGKSTLLFIMGGMLRPSSGEVIVNYSDIAKLSEHERNVYRAKHVGFVFQSYHLLPYLNVKENIMVSNSLNTVTITEEAVLKMVEQLGILDRLYHKPAQLSAGERQRVALARALITNPSLILADEPTGNLDEKNTIEVMNYLKAYQEKGGTVIMVTHGHLADNYATRTIRLQKGQLI
ncbi:ABC transporter ATP-binding protein [Aestuariivivens sp. NBU2969]|uniref:ABC transporter ATP-binding protein n=1 Tax=Aestuariivivens sp. NBU2969 TaxID=2873267 RepID=UPI001CBC3E69|nr:ABC transporter ATP-binding protein [Aestuariivivens sp. NBU2969]